MRLVWRDKKIPQKKSNIATGRNIVRKKSKEFTATFAAIAIAVLSTAMVGSRPSTAAAQQANEPTIDGDDIGGIVSGPNGPEAGVWVIAESVDLPTKFAKIVV